MPWMSYLQHGAKVSLDCNMWEEVHLLVGELLNVMQEESILRPKEKRFFKVIANMIILKMSTTVDLNVDKEGIQEYLGKHAQPISELNMHSMKEKYTRIKKVDDMEIIHMPNGPWSRVEGIDTCTTVDEAIDKVIEKCNVDGDFSQFDRIFTHIMTMYMDDYMMIDIAGTFILDFALKAQINGDGLAKAFSAFLHLIAGF
jgi:hypothetical protein